MHIQIEEQNRLLKNVKQVLEYKLHITIDENMWLTIETSLKSFIEKYFESKSRLS